MEVNIKVDWDDLFVKERQCRVPTFRSWTWWYESRSSGNGFRVANFDSILRLGLKARIHGGDTGRYTDVGVSSLISLRLLSASRLMSE